MKKLITLLLALVLSLGLTACGETGPPAPPVTTVIPYPRKAMAAPCTRPPYSWPATATFPAASRA